MKNFVRLYNLLGFIALFVLSVVIVPPVWLTQKQADALFRFTERTGLNYGDTYIAGMILMHLIIATTAFLLIKFSIRKLRG